MTCVFILGMRFAGVVLMKLAYSKCCCFFRTGANSPTNLTAEQVNSTAIRVSWTPPASGSTVTGYRIYYWTVGDQGSVDVGASTTEYTITSLVVNDTYIITLVALSEHLPSAIVGPEIIIPGIVIWVIWKGMVW